MRVTVEDPRHDPKSRKINRLVSRCMNISSDLDDPTIHDAYVDRASEAAGLVEDVGPVEDCRMLIGSSGHRGGTNLPAAGIAGPADSFALSNQALSLKEERRRWSLVFSI